MASSPKIDDLRKKFEENPRRYFAPLANEYRKAGDIEQAIAICREYLPQQPGHMSGHIVFGQALYEARQLEEAKTVFETALSLDPENLIALKHLGDISLMSGDTEAAKTWYKRVLEADPRNEETQAQLASLEAAGKPPAAATPVVSPAAPAVESLSTAKTESIVVGKPAPSPSSAAPTVVMKAMGPPPRPGHPPNAPAKPAAPPIPAAPTPAVPAAPAPGATAQSATTEIRMEGLSHGAGAAQGAAGVTDIPKTLVMEALTTPPAKDAPHVAPTMGLETTSMAGSEAPAMDSFSLEGLETTSLSAPPPPPPQPATAEVPALDLDLPAAPPAPAPVAAPAPAPVEMAALDLDLPPTPPVVSPQAAPAPSIDLDFGALPTPAAPPAPAPVMAEAPAIEIADLAPPTPAAPQAAPPIAEIDLSFAPPPVPTAAPEPAAPAPAAPVEMVTDLPMIDVDAPSAAPVAPPPEPAPFVTETMAELYLQQGHREEALRVYRALLEAKPGDAGLHAKVASLEAPPTPPAAVEGPTIREVLVLIAQRRPGFKPEGSNGHAAHAPDAAHSAPPAAPGSRWAADALGALWGHAQPDAAEETAAQTLATAFADLNGGGHAAALDLSAAAAASSARPAVAVPAPSAPASSFSFDKFFSQRATAEHATQASAQAPQSESKEDVAQFTRWLEGLKQQ